jgi:hypothetical protein
MELSAALEPHVPMRAPVRTSRYQLEQKGSWLVMIPQAAATGSSQGYLYRLVPDSALLVGLLEELVAMVKE